jgi:hypothetical protein
MLGIIYISRHCLLCRPGYRWANSCSAASNSGSESSLTFWPAGLYCPVLTTKRYKGAYSGTGFFRSACRAPISLRRPLFLALGRSAVSCFFGRTEIRKYRVSLRDIPIVLWCVVPLCSYVVNRLSLWSGLISALYLSLAWLVPYSLGRLFFRDRDSLLLVAKAIVLEDLSYLPICLLELFTGPQLYFHISGYEPFRWTGAQRYVGFRPIGFLEDGNQLGIWMATSALLATAFWIRRLEVRNLRLRAHVVIGCAGGLRVPLITVRLDVLFTSLSRSRTSGRSGNLAESCEGTVLWGRRYGFAVFAINGTSCIAF